MINGSITPKVVDLKKRIFMKMSLCGAKLINMVQKSQYFDSYI
ncbi:hypothetical protein VCRA2113O415_420003 [Vibrio crassostreae]|nr:hypothetical protein VCRA2110O182_320025 [Vibrio crassostreae]CAK2331950.1 hypothetical protein VCRA2111O408_330025 [Vibrio crassostreae]CAK2348463.1 hypothetical protein VCRA211O406_330004 [Vibrio crassostreae]CAK2499393.1 hypothetical protein VCRA2113O415_420003 [Vibrio crassostreae]CAK2857870.1 hypothetical protein VCRA2113O420_400003 [Vibrio crassostreae]